MMRILHLASHAGGGIGTVLMALIEADKNNSHEIVLLDYANDKIKQWAGRKSLMLYYDMGKCDAWRDSIIATADIVLVHFWDHPMMYEFMSRPVPKCRMVAWCHQRFDVSRPKMEYFDRFINTSPVQGHFEYIWSTGNMRRFFELQPKKHRRFNVGYVGTIDYKKLHPEFIPMCRAIAEAIPDVRFTVVGEMNLPDYKDELQMSGLFTFTGKVNDVARTLRR